MEGMHENSERKNDTDGYLPAELYTDDICIVNEANEETVVDENIKTSTASDYLEVIKNFLGFSGGSIFYCLSAASIMYGLCQIIGPALAESVDLKVTFPSILAVNLYELALIGVLLLIVLYRNVFDDAIFVIVLVSVFLITSGVVLGTVTPGNPYMCIAIGAVCVLVGLGKLYVLRRYIGVPFGGLSFIGIGIILLWNFLAVPIMSTAFVRWEWADEQRRLHLLISWAVFLAGALMILADAILSKTDLEREPANETPFIRKPAMVWVFSLVLLAGGWFYHYAIGYMFVIETSFGDYLPLAAVFAFLAIELLACYGKRLMRAADVIACVPLVLTVFAIADEKIIGWTGNWIGFLWYPQIILSVCCGIVLVQAMVHRRESFYYIGFAYALGILLTLGYSVKSPDLNWELFGGGLFAIVLGVGIIKRSAVLCFASVILLAGGLGFSNRFAEFARANELTIPGAITLIAGLGTMLLCIVFGEKAQRGMLLFAAISMMVFFFDYQRASLGLRDLGVLVIIAGLSTGLWLRFGVESLYAAPIFVPLVPRGIMVAVAMSSWGFIILSFVLLMVGGAVSFFYKNNLPNMANVSDASGDTWVSDANE